MAPRSSDLPGGGGGISSCGPPSNTLPSVDAQAWLRVVACDRRSPVYPCELMCLHTICWLCSTIAHFETTRLPHPPLPSFVFPFSLLQWKEAGICQNLPFILSALSILFISLFFWGGSVYRWLPLKFSQPWHPDGVSDIKTGGGWGFCVIIRGEWASEMICHELLRL